MMMETGMNPLMMDPMNLMMGMGANPTMIMGQIYPIVGTWMNPSMQNQMNPMMGMLNNPLMMMDHMNHSQIIEDSRKQKWNLVFKNHGGGIILIQIEPDQYVYEAINLYKIRARIKESDNVKFLYNGKLLYSDLIIYKSGLCNGVDIEVIFPKCLVGAVEFHFNFINYN